MMRLDQLLVERGEFSSREKARRTIMAGRVQVDGRRVDKPGTAIAVDAVIEVSGPESPYVSRGGLKLAGALDHFALSVQDLVCIDVGASTGGFTDCLLQRGARRVYAVDVGYGQLDYGLRMDERVVVMERFNARHLGPKDLPEACDLATFDVSFISLGKVVPAVASVVRPGGRLVTLIKPQFEVGKGRVGKGGVVRDEELRRQVITERIADLESTGLTGEGWIDAPITGARGNLEALALFVKP
jgi:23S rRNA (cytidine1920-2'-O)/16S rRNA (cytidine1409-2'-O)-methyltransferase